MLNANHPVNRTARKAPSDAFIVLILALAAGLTAAAADPPPDLARRVARREAETKAARDHYTYRQTVVVEELDNRGSKRGEYRETRDIIFSLKRERTEIIIGQPFQNLKFLKMTDEDFADIRDIQPFVLTEDRLWNYETKYRGEENIEATDCWVLQVRPRQILQGQRLFDGILWIRQSDFNILRSEGKAVPQIRGTKSENLFPRFTTIRRAVDGQYWFPVHTYADGVLQFRTGPQRERLTIRYSNYQKFSADSTFQPLR